MKKQTKAEQESIKKKIQNYRQQIQNHQRHIEKTTITITKYEDKIKKLNNRQSGKEGKIMKDDINKIGSTLPEVCENRNMNREEIQLEIEKVEGFISSNRLHEKSLNMRLAKLEKQLAELEVEVYEPIYLNNVGKCVYATENEKYVDNKYIERHNAGEELKRIISEENAKQGWKVDWKDEEQQKYYLDEYDTRCKEVDIDWRVRFPHHENELYFSEKSASDKDFLDKIKPLWLKWKGITE